MCILAHRVAAAQTTPPTPPAQALTPLQRQQLAREALAGQSISGLAHQHQVSRKFVYQQRARADQALSDAFTAQPADEQVLFYLPVTKAWLRQLVLGLVLIGHSCCAASSNSCVICSITPSRWARSSTSSTLP